MTANDPMAPKPNAVPSMAGRLRRITLCGSDAAACRRFYVDVMGLREAPPSPAPAQQAIQRRLWDLAPDEHWAELNFRRFGSPETPTLRILVMAREHSEIRVGLDALIEGGLSIGFAVSDMRALIDRAAALGFATTNGIVPLRMKRTDGMPYDALECHFRAPDSVYGLGVERPADLNPVAAIPKGSSVAGPAYSGQVANHADPSIRFYTDVLGWEVRRDVTATSNGPKGGLGLADGTPMRFLQLFEPTSTSGYLIFLDFADNGRPSAVKPSLPNRGLVAWTFPVGDIDEAAKRVRACGFEIVAGPQTLEDGDLGLHRIMTARTPNGFLIELVQS